MTDIAKVQKTADLKKADDDAVMASDAPSSRVITITQTGWHGAQINKRAFDRNAFDNAKAELNGIGEEILAEQAVKVAPRASGHAAVSTHGIQHLGARGGETPPRDSPNADIDLCVWDAT